MGTGSKVALAAAVAFAFFMLADSASAKGKKMKLPTGPKVAPSKSHPSGDAADWARTRFAAALDEVKRQWAGDVDDDKAKQIALSMLTHWSIETGNGANEYNNNVGNITAVGAQSFYVLRDISGVDLPFRNFDTLADGVRAYVELLKSARYAGAAYQLANDPDDTAWWIALGKAGWFDPTKAKPPISWDAMAASFAARRANLAQYATVEGEDIDGDVYDVAADEAVMHGDVGPDTQGEGES